MKIKKKVASAKVEQSTKSIVGCLLEESTNYKKYYKTAQDVFGEEILLDVETICRDNDSREAALAKIKELLTSTFGGLDTDYLAAILESSFRCKVESERILNELSSDS
jgi:hypothetical protein